MFVSCHTTNQELISVFISGKYPQAILKDLVEYMMSWIESKWVAPVSRKGPAFGPKRSIEKHLDITTPPFSHTVIDIFRLNV